MKILVIGSGFSGATVAYLLSKKGHEVTVLEGSSCVGGGCCTHFYGRHPYTFGPRVFFTKDEEVFSYLSSIIELREFYTKSWTYVSSDGNFYNYPIQFSDFPKMPKHNQILEDMSSLEDASGSNFESYWLSVVGETLYNMFISEYSKKMWGVASNKELTIDFDWVNKGIPIRNGDNRLYGDCLQGYPSDIGGYNNYFQHCLKDCNVILNCPVLYYEDGIVKTKIANFQSDVVISTIHIDTLFNYQCGILKYHGRDLIKITLPIEFALDKDITWVHYSGREPYTRLTEFKKITGYKSPHTLIGIEIPSSNNRLYPVPTKEELLKANKYKELVSTYNNLFSIGRLGNFRYMNISDAIREAIDISKEV
jgi:UDP-galactopyranose mutase